EPAWRHEPKTLTYRYSQVRKWARNFHCEGTDWKPVFRHSKSCPSRAWKHKERGFSASLESNLDTLSQAIGVALSDPQRELLAGTFQVDLVGGGYSHIPRGTSAPGPAAGVGGTNSRTTGPAANGKADFLTAAKCRHG